MSNVEELTGPHLPADTFASALATGEPSTFEPLYTFTVTGSDSLAVPLNDGLVSFDGEGTATSDTSGGLVLTTNVRASLLPVAFPSELASSATAV